MIRRAIQRLLLWFLYAPAEPERKPSVFNAGLWLQAFVIAALALFWLSLPAGAMK